MNENKQGKTMRLSEIDVLRGISIILMIVYHFLFDLEYFGIMHIDLHSFPLVIFQRIIGVSFLLLSGISITLSGKDYSIHWKRALFLGAVALMITTATWIYPHDGFITFGVIHLLAASSILVAPFLKRKNLALITGIVIVLIGLYLPNVNTTNPHIFPIGITTPTYTALDYYPIFPWLGVVLLGVWVGETFYPDKAPLTKLQNYFLELLGKNSLLIYLVHQPVVITGLWLIKIF